MRISDLSQKLTLGKDGIWLASRASPVSYPDRGNRECLRIEDSSFWFRHRNECIIAGMKRFPPPGPVLDVGGGNGYVTARMIDEGFDAILLEPGPVGALNAKNDRHIPNVICATLKDACIDGNSIAAVSLFDVLEHIEDDRAFAERVALVLMPGGLLYATVPAHHWLWSPSDDFARHYRRYDRPMLAGLLGTRFDLLYCTYFFQALTLPALLLRAIPYRLGLTKKRNIMKPDVEHATRHGPTSAILARLLGKEPGMIQRGACLSMGASCFVVARKRNDAEMSQGKATS